MCRVRVTRAHLEEARRSVRTCVLPVRAANSAPQDSGKLVHVGAAGLAGSSNSLADYNRAGTPLVEIVSEPDLRSGREAAAYGAEIQRVVRFGVLSAAKSNRRTLRDLRSSWNRCASWALVTETCPRGPCAAT